MTADLAPHRPATCIECGNPWLVLEIPTGHIDPHRYRCPDCMEERAAIRRERHEQRPPVPYGEFPAGY